MSKHVPKPDPPAEPRRPYGLLAEYEDVDTLLHAAGGVRDAGFTRWDCHTPFPVHGLNRAMGMKHTRLPWVVLLCGLTGAAAGLGLQLYTMERPLSEFIPAFIQGYGFIVSGKPYQSGPAFIPVTFELTVLLSAFGAFLGMLFMNGLPRLHHPLFNSVRFRRSTDDRFFIAVQADDPLYDRDRAMELLKSSGAVNVEEIED